MQNKFTQKAQNTLTRAMSVAGELGHSFIGSEHILLGLALEKDSIAAKILASRGIMAAEIKNYIVESEGEGVPSDPSPYDMTPRAKRIIELSSVEARKRGCSFIGTEHLLAAIIGERDCMAARIIESMGVPCSELKLDILNFQSTTIDKKIKESERDEDTKAKKLSHSLKNYSKDITELAAKGMLDPVIARDTETERVIQILSRRQKNNPCLVGEPGVGKTAVVEGLAQRISDGTVPDSLKGKRILSLDIPSMVAGAKYRGEFEDRMKHIMAEASNDKSIILFIDEIHMIIGAGAAEGAIDAANIMKPALSRGELQVIGATTSAEYHKNIERDAALERRFHSVLVEEPTEADSIAILKALRPKYEAHHNLTISDEAIIAAVKLSARYIHDRYLPDKAIDLIDEAASRVRITGSLKSSDTPCAQKELDRILEEKEAAVKEQNFEKAAQLRQEELKYKEQLSIDQLINDTPDDIIVTEKDIGIIITQQTGIPQIKLMQGENADLLELEKNLKKKIIGQDDAIDRVCRAIRRGRSGIKDPKRPTGSFIFLGPTGVGKTELASAIASELFGSESSLFRFDMSEYMERHSLSRLIGSPPGYVGYGEGGQLTERIRRKPYSVVLFDEIEKAHPDIFNLLLQILEDGMLTDSQGRRVDFCNCIIIMTSNVGSSYHARHVLGFSSSESKSTNTDHQTSALQSTFKPEFLNRVDEIVPFNLLDRSALESISAIMLDDISDRASQLGITISFDRSVISLIASEAHDRNYGARPLRRAVIRLIEDKLATEILESRIVRGDKVIAVANEKNISFIGSSDISAKISEESRVEI